MWISNKDYNGLLKIINDKDDTITELKIQGRLYASRNYNYKKELEIAKNESEGLKKDLDRTRKMLWNLQTECDEKDIYRKLGHKSQMCNALKLKNKELEKELDGTRELVKSQQREIEDYRKTLKNVSKYNEAELLKQELKEAYETISKLESEREELEQKLKNAIYVCTKLSDNIGDKNKELKEVKEQCEHSLSCADKDCAEYQRRIKKLKAENENFRNQLKRSNLGAFYE